MRTEVRTEILEAELRGLHQVADEGQRVLQDALERGAGALDVLERAGADDVEYDLQQVPDGITGPGDEAADEVAEDRGDFREGPWNQNDVDELQRLEGIDRQRRNLGHKPHEGAQRTLEPGPRAPD